jgi:hypothetical protein
MPDDFSLRNRVNVTHDISEALRALHQQWQRSGMVSEPVPPRQAMPEPAEDYIDMEPETDQPKRTPERSGAAIRRSRTMDLLDRLNHTGPYHGQAEEEESDGP